MHYFTPKKKKKFWSNGGLGTKKLLFSIIRVDNSFRGKLCIHFGYKFWIRRSPNEVKFWVVRINVMKIWCLGWGMVVAGACWGL